MIILLLCYIKRAMLDFIPQKRILLLIRSGEMKLYGNQTKN